ncbi:protein phosphatase 1L isoform X2 [Phymastichus coffea]|uniref:protein phosphatase 1L isoform X2 n=1 Tax=Phymastichus coffea TaxID=108790 RepID=UPI00273A77F8|nr:protein phosphatase 1L isoform X2 [Phymastichus coffea]
MDDELEDRTLYQTYLSHMKLISKFVVGIPTVGINTPMGQVWRIAKSYFLKPEILLFGIILLAIFIYLQTVDAWSRAFLRQIQHQFGHTKSKVRKFQFLVDSSSGKLNWEFKQGNTAAYAVQGHRSHMEDRFVVNHDINNTGVSLFAIFDGHGGEFAANYARDKLVPSISEQVTELKNILSGKVIEKIEKAETRQSGDSKNQEPNDIDLNLLRKKKLLRKTGSTDDYTNKNSIGITDPELLDKLDSISKTITREVRPNKFNENKSRPKIDIRSYLDGNKINYGKLLTDQVLEIDSLLIEAAKKNKDLAGTTALIAILEDNKLIVANVGDSRGVMCDGKGNAIPLSFDHKPQQQREKNRINKAGGVVTFNGVWRVAGILATSRALGDYPLKNKKLVIADPDILTFDLDDHNPMFIVLASDGLWDTFSNEEAVAYIKERINEPHFGAKSITLQSFYRGSLDNITVLVINLKSRSNNGTRELDEKRL